MVLLHPWQTGSCPQFPAFHRLPFAEHFLVGRREVVFLRAQLLAVFGGPNVPEAELSIACPSEGSSVLTEYGGSYGFTKTGTGALTTYSANPVNHHYSARSDGLDNPVCGSRTAERDAANRLKTGGRGRTHVNIQVHTS
jgi:hypothetical protein